MIPATRTPETFAPLEIVLPDPSLVILCGPSGAGKSTFAQQQFRPTQIVSSDRCRSLISDSEAFGPDSSGRAFALLYETIRHRLALRRFTVADTTALERSSRAQLLALAQQFNLPAVLIVLAVRQDECVRRNRERQRNVGPRVIARQHRLLRTALLSAASEPFHSIHILTEERMSNVRVRLASEAEARSQPQTPGPAAGPARPVPFEGWVDPWNSFESPHSPGAREGAEGAMAAASHGSVSADIASEIQRLLGPVDPERRRAALHALNASEVDPRWILFRPALPQPAPRDVSRSLSEGDHPEVCAPDAGRVLAFCDSMQSRRFARLCLEAWPARAEPVALVLAREPFHALRLLGIEGSGALFAGPGQAILDEESARLLVEQIVQDLDSAAFFSRRKSPLVLAQALAVWTLNPRPARPALEVADLVRPDGQLDAWAAALRKLAAPEPTEAQNDHALPQEYFQSDTFEKSNPLNPYRPRHPAPDSLQLWLTEVLHPADPPNPRDPDFLWAIAETCDLSDAFALPPRTLVDLRQPRGPDSDLLLWWEQWAGRPGWDIVLTHATQANPAESAGGGEIVSIGWTAPPWRLSRPKAGPDRRNAEALWICRAKAIEALASGRSARPWRPWVAAAWSLDPPPTPIPQQDLFSPSR